MLKLNNVSFRYDQKSVLKNINLTIQKGEHVSIIGESGCGKSTLLKSIYGLFDLDEGEIFWNNTQVLGPAYNLVPGMPQMKYLSQNFDLMPHISVKENISQYLSVFFPEALEERTQELLDLIKMTAFANTKVKLLSGGQQQRVALARVLAQKPEVLLLDEPFGHIDNFLKNSLRRNIFNFAKKNNITCITATHDYNDVLPFADRIIVLKDNNIIADNTTQELYQNPKEIYIASLFGEANLIPISVLKPYANTEEKIIVYAHEFKVSKSSGFKIIPKKKYPMGSFFLIEGVYNEQIVYFNSNEDLTLEEEVFLNIPIDIINKRLP